MKGHERGGTYITCNLCPAPGIMRVIKSARIRWTGYAMAAWEKSVYRIMVGKAERKRPLGKPRCR
jgi:hypothetical protein